MDDEQAYTESAERSIKTPSPDKIEAGKYLHRMGSTTQRTGGFQGLGGLNMKLSY
jgi:hypothetical protein